MTPHRATAAAIVNLLDQVEVPLRRSTASALRKLVAARVMKGVPAGFDGNGLSIGIGDANRLAEMKLAIITRPEGTGWRAATIVATGGGIAWVKARAAVEPVSRLADRTQPREAEDTLQ